MTTQTSAPTPSFADAYGELDYTAIDYEHLRTMSDGMVPFGNQVGTTITELGGERQGVAVEDPLHCRAATTEAADDVRERDRGDAGVEVDDERHGADTEQKRGRRIPGAGYGVTESRPRRVRVPGN